MRPGPAGVRVPRPRLLVARDLLGHRAAPARDGGRQCLGAAAVPVPRQPRATTYARECGAGRR
eukprot:6022459-Alexandrium_andersonii.AAC.1